VDGLIGELLADCIYLSDADAQRRDHRFESLLMILHGAHARVIAAAAAFARTKVVRLGTEGPARRASREWRSPLVQKAPHSHEYCGLQAETSTSENIDEGVIFFDIEATGAPLTPRAIVDLDDVARRERLTRC